MAALAATQFVGATPAATAYSDYLGLDGLEGKPMHTITYRKSIYAGVRVQIKARAPEGFRICKVPAHIDPETCTEPRARFLALGNAAADRIAKGAALASAGGPTPAELEDWERQSAFLQRYLRYIPAALALWPQASPTSCKKSFPRRPDADSSRRNRGASFRSDVLSGLRRVRAAAAPASSRDEPAEDGVLSQSGPAEVSDGFQTRECEGPEKHIWRWQYSRWICSSCLTTSRTAVPPRSKCPGMATNLRSLLNSPRGHALQIATFTDCKGLVVICSKCGHHATSNRPTQLHKQVCPKGFGSDGARHSYQRVCRGQHPKYSKGPAKVLDPCMSPAMLMALARTGADTQEGGD